MTNEINIDGNDNLVLSQITGSQVTVNQFLAQSQEYGTLEERLAELRDMLGFIPATEQQKRGQTAAKISALEDQMKSFQQNVISLAKTFKALEEKPEININNTRLEKAKEHFIGGNFTAARAILEQDIEAIKDEGKVLLGHKAEFEEKKAKFEQESGWYAENVLPKLELKAYEYLILAQTTALNYESPTRVADAGRYFANSIECATSFENLFAYAGFLWEHSYFSESIAHWKPALEIARKGERRQNEGNCLGNLGIAYKSIGEYEKAIGHYKQALEIAREIGDRLGEGQSLGNLGNAYYLLGDYQKAIEFHEQMLKITREIGDRLGEGQSLGNLGLAYYSLGEYRKAIEFQEQRLKIAREIGDRSGEGKGLGSLGLAYDSLGEYQKAIEFHEQMLKIARELGDRLGEGQSLGNLGRTYYLLGDYQETIGLQEQRLKITREIGDRLGEGQSLGNLGVAYYALGEYQKAIEFQKQSIKIAREIGDRPGEGSALANLGLTYNSLGETDKACEYWRQALVLFKTLGVPRAGMVREWMKQAGCEQSEQ